MSKYIRSLSVIAIVTTSFGCQQKSNVTIGAHQNIVPASQTEQLFENKVQGTTNCPVVDDQHTIIFTFPSRTNQGRVHIEASNLDKAEFSSPPCCYDEDVQRYVCTINKTPFKKDRFISWIPVYEDQTKPEPIVTIDKPCSYEQPKLF